MTLVNRARFVSVVLFVVVLLYGIPAFAQSADLAGEYAGITQEDAMERAGGPPLGDYMGIPLSDAGRMRAESNNEAIWGLPEFSCRPHPQPYNWRSQGSVQIRKEIDPTSRQLIAYHIQFTRSLDWVVYMDGRPHPDENAEHTWSGFATGRYVGNVLEVTIDHLKEGYTKRNGVMFSDEAKATEFIYRRGDLLSIVSVLSDPYYLTEPFVVSTNFRYSPNAQLEFFPCTVIDEGLGNREVPHFLPGQNPYLLEFTAPNNIPPEAAKGGAETAYPEYLKKIKK